MATMKPLAKRWYHKEIKHPNSCMVCGKKLVAPEMVWMRKASKTWEFLCEPCHSKIETEFESKAEALEDVSIESLDEDALAKLLKETSSSMADRIKRAEIEGSLEDSLMEGKKPNGDESTAVSGEEKVMVHVLKHKPGTLEYIVANARWKI